LGLDTSQGPPNDPGHPAGRFRNLQSQNQSLDTYNTVINSLNPSLLSDPNPQSAQKNQIPQKNNFLPENHKFASENPNFDNENQNFACKNQRKNPENLEAIPRDQNQIDIYEDDWEDDCTPPYIIPKKTDKIENSQKSTSIFPEIKILMGNLTANF
jgi:hypothetical protein